VPEPAAAVLLRELILVDALYRERAGETVQPADYRARFPNLESAWLAAALPAGATQMPTTPGRPASIQQPQQPAVDRSLDSGEGPDDAALVADLRALDRAYWDRLVASQPTARVRGPAAGDEASAKLDMHSQALGSCADPAVTSWPAVPGLVLEKVLGSGGMGVVLKARQPTLDRDVAVKFLRDPHLADAAHHERFKQEARAVARLQHPNLVQLYEFGEVSRADGTGAQPYLVLEYVSGGSLAQRLRGARLPPMEAARLVESLAQAIHYAHQQGVIHRDLKPANILLQIADSSAQIENQSAIPKITDFGLAKFLAGSSLTVTGDVLGTPSYMAPEQTTGKSADITPAVDVYGLGAILYEALSGRPPFAAETRVETVRQVQEEEPLSPRRLKKIVPRDLETICLKCLRREPGRRYASAQELADDLRRFRCGEPIRARRVGAAERVLVWCRRRPLVAGLLVALAVVFMAGVCGVIWNGSWPASAGLRSNGNKSWPDLRKSGPMRISNSSATRSTA